MDLKIKQWVLNIFFFCVITCGIALLFLDHRDSTTIIITMIGVPLGALASEMGVYSVHIAKDYSSKKKE